MVRDCLKIIALVILMAPMMISCSDNDPSQESDSITDAILNSIYVAAEAPVAPDGLGDDDDENSKPIIINGFEDGSLLYFSQMPQSESPNFSDLDESATPYLYIYKYNKNESATWERGENFSNAFNNRLSFDWDFVKGIGPNGNAFKFFAFYYPVGNVVRWNVETDQTGGADSPYDQKNFMKSDIMGAYHATSAIFTRMRFRLFHLMTYLKVTLYVPVYKDDISDPDKMSYSGFNAGAMKGSYILNAFKDFSIEWSAAKSSDTEAPLVQIPGNAGRSNIRMYEHQPDESVTKTINVKPYYSGTVEGITNYEDEVREYNFSVLFPTQPFNDNFICFALTTPGNDTKYYYFSASQIIGAEGDSFGLTQGTLQQLYLYLPRKTNQTILVGAKILPWNNSVTDMTVNKQKK